MDLERKHAGIGIKGWFGFIRYLFAFYAQNWQTSDYAAVKSRGPDQQCICFKG